MKTKIKEHLTPDLMMLATFAETDAYAINALAVSLAMLTHDERKQVWTLCAALLHEKNKRGCQDEVEGCESEG